MAFAQAHTKCRGDYAGGVTRYSVPDDKVSWSINWPDYKPIEYTAPVVETGSARTDMDIRCDEIKHVQKLNLYNDKKNGWGV